MKLLGFCKKGLKTEKTTMKVNANNITSPVRFFFIFNGVVQYGINKQKETETKKYSC